MRFTEPVKEFWATGYQLFHGKFLRFMGGTKGRGESKYEHSLLSSLSDPGSNYR